MNAWFGVYASKVCVHFNGPFGCYERIMVIQTFNNRPSSHSRDLQSSAEHCVRLHVCFVYSANWRNRNKRFAVSPHIFSTCVNLYSVSAIGSATCDRLYSIQDCIITQYWDRKHLCDLSVLLGFGVWDLHYLFVICCVLSHHLGLLLYTTSTWCFV